MKLLFAGTPAFAAGYLESLIASDHEVVAVITQPDRPGKRGKKLIPSPVKQIADEVGIPVLQPEKLKLDHLAELPADLMIVVAYGQILRQPVLDHPRLGCINVHASLLPRWRGAAPVQRALLAGDTETGVTLMQMDAGLDTGDMLRSASVEIEPHDTAGSLLEKLGHVGKPLLIELLENLSDDHVQGETQDDAESTYASKLEKDEAKISWRAASEIIDRQVRAFQPDPIAFCFLGDKRIKIHEGQATAEPQHQSKPGDIISVSKQGVLVACGEGAYLVKKIQIPVGKGAILSGADVLNGWGELVYPGVQLS